MGYHNRIECENVASFQTTRSRNSELWFVNNHELENKVLGYVAKYGERYGITLFAFAIEGNHCQFPAFFPKCNRSHFMRDLNSSVAKAIPLYCPAYRGGLFWGRRYSAEYLNNNAAIEKQFFYTVLQPVHDGLVERISDYPGYNCFHDAVCGIKRQFKLVDWTKYNAARRYKKNANIPIKNFVRTYELEYTRLPGYEKLSRGEYKKLMEQKLEHYRQEIVKKRLAEGLGFVGREALLRTKPGAIPRNTKRGDENTHRPRVLSWEAEIRAAGRAWYFSMREAYVAASKRFRAGELDVKFPPGTYRPPSFTVNYRLKHGDIAL